jgi:outer membrane protein TolC
VLQITQLVYDGGAAAQRTSAAQARVVQSANDRLALAASLTLQTVEAWHEVLHRRRLLELAGRNLALHQEFLRQTEDRVEAGAGAETDLLTAQSRLADASARRITAQSRLERAEAEFRELYGNAPAAIAPPAPAPGLPGTATDIVEQSPRLRSIDASILAAQAELQAARAGTRPNLVMRVTGGTDASGRADVGANLGLQYDLDTGRRRAASVRTAEARVLELEAEREGLARQISRALDFVRSDQRAGAERLRAALVARRANEANVAAVREQFTIGRRGITELLDAQRDFIASSEALLEAELELAISGYAALALTGDIIDVFGITLPSPRSAVDPSR